MTTRTPLFVGKSNQTESAPISQRSFRNEGSSVQVRSSALPRPS
jgi:hypothetical protein